MANVGDVNRALCPCCNQVLYKSTLEQGHKGGDTIWLTTKDSPRVERDGKGHYIKCRACSQRVAMIEDPRLPDSEWSVALEQPCNQKLP